MRLVPILVLIISVFFSCSDKENIYPDWGTDVECRTGIQFGDTVFLDELTREYSQFWDYKVIVYKNASGEQLRFRKSDFQSPVFFGNGASLIKCKGLHPNTYFFPLENINIIYVSDENYNLNFNFGTSTTQNREKFTFVDNLQLSYSANGPNNYFQYFFNIPVTFRGLTETEYYEVPGFYRNYDQIDSIKLLDKTFYNVKKVTLQWQTWVEFYITKEHGMAGYKDQNNNLWVWDRFEN